MDLPPEEREEGREEHNDGSRRLFKTLGYVASIFTIVAGLGLMLATQLDFGPSPLIGWTIGGILVFYGLVRLWWATKL